MGWGGGGGKLGEANCPRYKLAIAEIYGRLFSEPHNYIPHKFLWPGGPCAFEVGSPSFLPFSPATFHQGHVVSVKLEAGEGVGGWGEGGGGNLYLSRALSQLLLFIFSLFFPLVWLLGSRNGQKFLLGQALFGI